MKSLAPLAWAAWILLILSGCSGPDIRSESSPGISLANYKSFDWVSEKHLEQPDDFSKKRDDVLDAQIKNQVDAYLTRQGLVRDKENPQLKVAYTVRSTRESEVEPGYYPEPFYSYWGEEPVERIVEKNKGSVDLDLMDAKSGRLLWRGVAVTDISDTGESSNQIKEALNDVLQRLPGQTKTG